MIHGTPGAARTCGPPRCDPCKEFRKNYARKLRARKRAERGLSKVARCKPGPKPQRKFPLAPLMQALNLPLNDYVGLEERTGGVIDADHLRTLHTRGGVNIWQADELAIGAGYHPLLIWPEWGDE